MAAPEIVHELPRRLRLRWPPLRDRRSDALYVQALLENIPGVTQVRVNRAAATLVLQHDGAPATRAAILARFDPLPGEAFRCFEPPQPAINPLNLAFLGVSIASLRLLPPTLQGTISLLIGLPTLPATSQVDFIVAHGVSAHVDGQQVLVGSHHFVAEDEGIDCGAAAEPAAAFARQGKNLLYVSRAGRLEGLIALRDRIRPETAGILTHLKQNGIRRIVVPTGDQESTARALLQTLPQIDALHWELQPEDKAGIVQQLRDRGHYTAFIGDGVNDAPALVTADVGISLPCGADLAKDAAQALLLQEDLTCLATALDAARRTRKTIQDSFYATIGFNSLFLLLALTGRIRPLTAALLHNLNTVGILGYCATRGLSASDPAARPAAPKDNPHDH